MGPWIYFLFFSSFYRSLFLSHLYFFGGFSSSFSFFLVIKLFAITIVAFAWLLACSFVVAVVVVFALSLDGIFSYRQSLKDLVAKANARRANHFHFQFDGKIKYEFLVFFLSSFFHFLGCFRPFSVFLSLMVYLYVCACQKDCCGKITNPLAFTRYTHSFTCGLKRRKDIPSSTFACLLAGYTQRWVHEIQSETKQCSNGYV